MPAVIVSQHVDDFYYADAYARPARADGMTPGKRLLELFKQHADGAGGFDFETIARVLIEEYLSDR